MDMIIRLDLGSIVLGLAAWIFAALGIWWTKRSQGLGLMSYICCSVSLIFQFCGIERRTELSDFSAIEDTIEGIIFCAVVLVVVTALLNVAAILRNRNRRNKS